MNFVNLAHGAFAMAGGYVSAILLNSYGVPFFGCCRRLPLGSADRPRDGANAPRSSLRPSQLDQVMFTIGLVFMSVSAVDYVMGSSGPHPPAADAARALRSARHRYRPLPAVHHRVLRPDAGGGATTRRAPASAAGCGPRGDARVAAKAPHQRAAGVRPHLRVRLGLAGLGGALGAET